MSVDTSSSRQVRCPVCGGPSLYASSNRFRPFCGERCKQLDLGAWASESFKMAEQVAPSSDEPVKDWSVEVR